MPQKGDKILLPPSAFDTLARLQVDYPMLFRLSTLSGRHTHSGVLEFTAEEGCCYIPYWMMQNLLVEEGALVTVTNVSLPKATFVKLQPQSVDFLEISNPRAVLEHALRNFSCVTAGDVIQIPYNNKNYHFALQQVKPADAACIIETDCQVDFDAPLGYQQPQQPLQSSRQSSACPSPTTTMSTTGSINGAVTVDKDEQEDAKPSGVRIVNGQIIRPDQPTATSQTSAISDLVADRVGSTGVQKNAAIPVVAPPPDYWAVAAGDGARLDGKPPSKLVDATGKEIDIRQLRAEAASRRAAEQKAASGIGTSNGGGRSVDGKTVVESQPSSTIPSVPVSKRQSRVGSKYSKLKSSTLAFQGSANNLQK